LFNFRLNTVYGQLYTVEWIFKFVRMQSIIHSFRQDTKN